MNSQLSLAFPPLPPVSQNVVTTADPVDPSGGIHVDDAAPTESQALSHTPVVSPSVSLSSPWGPLSSVHGARRIFLDICCGVNRPLSNAVLSLGGDCFSFDCSLVKMAPYTM